MKTYYFIRAGVDSEPQVLTNLEAYARRYAEKNMERCIVFTLDGGML